MTVSVSPRTALAIALMFSVLITLAPKAQAARPSLQLGTVKADGGSIVTGEVLEAQSFPVEPAAIDGETGQPRIKGYAYTVSVHEVLLGTVPEPTIHLPFSPAGYATNWEWGKGPTQGMKLLLYLKPKSGAHYETYAYCNGVEHLKGFDDAAVIGLKKIIEVWRLNTAEDQLDAVRKGCFSRDPRFQRWCLRVVAGRGHSEGLDLSNLITPEQGRALLKVVFFTKDMWYEGISECNYLLQHDEEFMASPERYEVFYNLLDHYATGEVSTDRIRFDAIARALLGCPGQAQRTFDQLARFAQQADRDEAFRAAPWLARLYEIADHRLKQQIVQFLKGLLTGQNPEGSACAFAMIARKAAEAGQVPADIMAVLTNQEGAATDPRAIMRLSTGLEEAQKILDERPKQGLERPEQ